MQIFLEKSGVFLLILRDLDDFRSLPHGFVTKKAILVQRMALCVCMLLLRLRCCLLPIDPGRRSESNPDVF